MHVDLSVRVVSGLIIMPCGLFGYERTSVDEHMNSSKDTGPCLCIGIPQLQVICRVHDHFMGKVCTILESHPLNLFRSFGQY